MNDQEQTLEHEKPQRIKTFAIFFKNYMGVSALITAALPIPITSFKLIPTYEIFTNTLSVYTSLFCFLVLAYIFYRRHSYARLMFPNYFYDEVFDSDSEKDRNGKSIANKKLYRKSLLMAQAPLMLILLSFACVIGYHYVLEYTLVNASVSDRLDVLAYGSPSPYLSILLNGLYLGIFIAAEAAFILMAIKEYLQDLLHYSEEDLIKGPRSPI